jgi:hypothetical protein
METRFMVTPDGRRIDIANQQNEIFSAWKSVNKPVEVAIALPEAESVDILNDYFHVSRTSHNLSVATHICAVAVEDYAVAGDTILTIGSDGKVTESVAQNNEKALVWKPWKAEFNPGYGPYNRVIVQPVDLEVNPTGATGGEEVFHDTIFASQKDNMFEINSGGKIKAIKM